MISKYKKLDQVDWNFPTSNNSGNNTLHPYPAKFIPSIPNSLISILQPSKKNIVFDPFCGSGTTLIEAQKAGYTSIGIDLNPIACLISKVATTKRHNTLRAIQIIEKAKTIQIKEDINIPRVDHWFKKDIQLGIAQLLKVIDQIQDDNSRDAARLALSSIIVKISNQDSDTRYAAVKKNICYDNIFCFFKDAITKSIKLNDEISNSAPKSTIICNDILKTSPDTIGKNIGLVITSPPYPNAYEYWLYHKYRMWWLGYNPEKVKNKEIGARPHYFKKNCQTIEDFEEQMLQVFNLLKDCLATEGHVAFVVGRSKIHGNIIDNSLIIDRVAKKVGLEKVWSTERLINPFRKSFNLAHAKIKKEHILLYRG